MRQAGRSLPEYRAIRGEGSILNAIARPDLATEITLQPVRRYGTDAAILYSDIVTPVHAIGFGVDIAPGIGPVVEQPFRSAADLDRLRPLDPEADTPYVIETVKNLVAELPVPLIAFAGAPFTVASYLIEGKPSRTYGLVKTLMLTDEPLWFRLMDRLADLAIASLRSQVGAGASAVQLFDSWAGALSPSQYERYVQPASRKVFDAVRDLDVPLIHFGVHTGELLGLLADAGADMVGVDWRTPAPTPRKGTRWSATLDEALRRGMAEGRSAAEIGAEIGRTPAAVESRMQRLGLVYANNAARMERMFRERWERASSVVKVTTALKLTRRAASEMAERLGLPPLPVGEVVKPVVPSAPQGITKAQIAWADLNADHPEARLISGMAAEKRRRVAA